MTNATIQHLWKHGDFNPAKAMLALLHSFPTLRDYPYLSWEPLQFQRWARERPGTGLLHAARFVLCVWNPSTRWRIGRFEITQAMACWDEPHRAAFVAWAKHPWWP